MTTKSKVHVAQINKMLHCMLNMTINTVDVKRKQSQSALHSTWRTEDVFLEKKKKIIQASQ
jgi:hypothetical protein